MSMPTLGGPLTAEVRKARSLSALPWIIGACLLVSLGLAALTVQADPVGMSQPVDPGAGTPVALALFAGSSVVPYLAAVMGSGSVTSEFSSGISRVLYAAIPMRWPIVLSKAVVQAAQAALLSLATVAAALVGMRLSRSSALGALDTTSAASTAVRMAVAAAAMAVLGVALGTVLRRGQRAVLGIVLLMVVAPILIAPLAGSVPPLAWVADLLPMSAVNHLSDLELVTAPTSGRATWVAWSALAMWSCGALAVAVRILNRADL